MAKRSKFMHMPDHEERTLDDDREPLLPEEVVEDKPVEVVPVTMKPDPVLTEWEVFGEHGSKLFTSVGDTLREVKHQLHAGCALVKIERR